MKGIRRGAAATEDMPRPSRPGAHGTNLRAATMPEPGDTRHVSTSIKTALARIIGERHGAIEKEKEFRTEVTEIRHRDYAEAPGCSPRPL